MVENPGHNRVFMSGGDCAVATVFRGRREIWRGPVFSTGFAGTPRRPTIHVSDMCEACAVRPDTHAAAPWLLASITGG